MHWGKEVSFRDLKYTIGAHSFHSRIDYLVTQEIWAELILFNIVTASIHEAVTEHETCDQTLSDPSDSAEPHVDPVGGEMDKKAMQPFATMPSTSIRRPTLFERISSVAGLPDPK